MFTGLVFISMNRGVLSWLIFTCYMSLMHLGVSPHQLFTLPNSIPVAFQSRPSLCPLSCWLTLNRVVATMCRYYSNYLPKNARFNTITLPVELQTTHEISWKSPLKKTSFQTCLMVVWPINDVDIHMNPSVVPSYHVYTLKKSAINYSPLKIRLSTTVINYIPF